MSFWKKLKTDPNKKTPQTQTAGFELKGVYLCTCHFSFTFSSKNERAAHPNE